MAIDYNSGSGIFDKLGVLINVINSIETFETGTLQTKLNAIQAELETANEYDDLARLEFYKAQDEVQKELRRWKQDLLDLVQPLLTQEMHDGETFFSPDLRILLKHLRFCMLRDSATVDGSVITLTGPTAGGSPVGNFSVLASDFAPTAQGADSSSQENGIAWSNTYRIVCIDNNVSGAETFRVEGDLPLNGRTHPNWENAGDAGRLKAICSSNNSLIANGGFENLNSAGTLFSNWAATTGVYTTNWARVSNPYRGTYALQFSTGVAGAITQTLPTDTLKPYSKYLITVRAKKANSADGTVNVGFTGTSGCFWTLAAASLTTSYVLYSHFFNTGADPGAIRDFVVSRTNTPSAGEVILDEVTLTKIEPIKGIGMAVVAGSTDAAIDDFWTLTVANGHQGVFMKFFGRFFDFLLPGDTGGSETIDDALAS